MNKVIVMGCNVGGLAVIRSMGRRGLHIIALTHNTRDFAQYSKYVAEKEFCPDLSDEEAFIKYLIDRQLRKRGMSESTIAPDMIVAFAAGVDMDALEFQVSPEAGIEVLNNVPRGGLLLVLIDSESGFAVWAGLATADIQRRPDTETAKARLDYAVTQLFKQLPK